MGWLYQRRRRRSLAAGGGGAPADPVETDLLCWLRADLGVTLNGSNVSIWADQTANGHDWRQNTVAEQPLFVASGIGGQATIRFDGTDDSLASDDDFLTGLTAAEIYIVLKIDTDPPAADPQTGLWVMGSDTQTTHFPFTDGIIYDQFGTTARKTTGDPTPLLTTPRIYNVSSAANAWTSRIDGVQHHTTGTNTVGWTATPVLGTSGGAGYFLDGDIAEMLIYSAVNSAGDRTLNHAYLGARYGITV